MQVPILNGIYTDQVADFRTSYPRNLIPVPKPQGISSGYLRPADGLVQFGTGPGSDRGGINWDGQLYRVMGTKLVRISAGGTVYVLGDVGAGGPVTMDYSFDRLAIASGGNLFYWDGTTLAQVTDPDLGTVVDFRWIAGYFLTTDGAYLIVTELGDPFAVNPLKYGSAESDPDPVMAIDELRNEAYAFGRYTVEVFQNIGGDGFPFQRIEGAQVPRGIIGTHAFAPFVETFAFVGSGFNEAPAVYLLQPGATAKLSTREIDQVLLTYTGAQLAQCVVEAKSDKNHRLLLIHLPDQCLVYDAVGSAIVKEPVWYSLTSSVVGLGAYRARGLVWCYDQWNVGDPTGSVFGYLVDNLSSHYGAVNGWDFGTMILYADGNGAIVHELELVCLTGHVASDVDPVIWTQYSLNGETWSQERSVRAGRQGQRAKRICWRKQGSMQHWRLQRFRGTSQAHLSIARLEMQPEPLFTQQARGGG